MSEERWLPVVGYEGLYEVSDMGRVRSLRRVTRDGQQIKGRILKERLLPTGRPKVSLCRDGSTVDAYPYRLALEAFVGACPDGMEALHYDDDPNNNSISNLRWGTRTDNMRDMARNGNGNAGLKYCPAGHPYDDENTYIYPGPRMHRGCRTCERLRSRKRSQERRKSPEKAA